MREEQQPKADNKKQSKEEGLDYSQLVPDLMIVLSCCQTSFSFTLCRRSRTARLSENNNGGRE